MRLGGGLSWLLCFGCVITGLHGGDSVALNAVNEQKHITSSKVKFQTGSGKKKPTWVNRIPTSSDGQPSYRFRFYLERWHIRQKDKRGLWVGRHFDYTVKKSESLSKSPNEKRPRIGSKKKVDVGYEDGSKEEVDFTTPYVLGWHGPDPVFVPTGMSEDEHKTLKAYPIIWHFEDDDILRPSQIHLLSKDEKKHRDGPSDERLFPRVRPKSTEEKGNEAEDSPASTESQESEAE